MSKTSNKSDFEETIDALGKPSFLISVFAVLSVVVSMQFMWETIEGLYFPYAYHAIIIPLILYVLHEIKIHSFDKKINTLKVSLIGASFLLLFAPAFHLFLSGQLTLHEMIFSTFNSGLDHMPFSEYLPFICLLMIILPIKNKSTKDGITKA